MPLFDLRCTKCGEEFSKMISFSKLKETTCPACSSEEIERVYKANFTGPVNRSSNRSGGSLPSSGFT